MLFRGQQNLVFASQTSILSTMQQLAYDTTLPSSYTLTLMSDTGSVSCGTCTLASDQNMTVIASQNVSGQSMVINSDNFVNTNSPNYVAPSRPTLQVQAQNGSVTISTFQATGNQILIQANNGAIVSSQVLFNSTLTISPQSGMSSILLNASTGMSTLSSGIIVGPTVNLQMDQLTVNDIIINATMASPLGMPNAVIYCNQTLTSNQNFTVRNVFDFANVFPQMVGG